MTEACGSPGYDPNIGASSDSSPEVAVMTVSGGGIWSVSENDDSVPPLDRPG